MWQQAGAELGQAQIKLVIGVCVVVCGWIGGSEKNEINAILISVEIKF